MKFLAHNPSFFFFKNQFQKWIYSHRTQTADGQHSSDELSHAPIRTACDRNISIFEFIIKIKGISNVITNLKRKRHSPLSELSYAPIRTAHVTNFFNLFYKRIYSYHAQTAVLGEACARTVRDRNRFFYRSYLKVGFVVVLSLSAGKSWAQESPSKKSPSVEEKSMNLKKEVPKIRSTMDVQSEKQKKAFEEKMQGAAELYEKQFLREMVNAMRSTIQYSDISQPTMAEKIYKDKLYEEYVDKWSQRGGVGFRDIIYQQLLERYSPYHRQQGNFAQRGPIELKKSHPKVLEDPPGGKNIPRLKIEE